MLGRAALFHSLGETAKILIQQFATLTAMVREVRQSADEGVSFAELAQGTRILVIGETEDGHGLSCRALVDQSGTTSPLRVCVETELDGRAVGDPDAYRGGAGTYDSLSLDEAGLVTTESMSNLTAAGDPLTGFHLCLDGIPAPGDLAARRTVFHFLHTLTRWVDAQDTGCHVHVAADPQSEFVETVAPLFDEILELRDGPEGRLTEWDSRDDATGSWTALSERLDA